MSFGPTPWQQTAWDWRAAGNFMAGGAGSGVVVFAALSGLLGRAAPAQFACGSALVVIGLVCVWFEIGRPWRALHVFFHPKRSWMSREAFVAALLVPCGVAAALGVPGAEFRRDPAGVWLGPAKLAACGIHIARGVSVHGFALNVCTPSNAWSRIRPCGLSVAQISLADARATCDMPPVTVEQVAAEAGPRLVAALL